MHGARCRAAEEREEREAVSELPPRALKRLLYYNNFVPIGPQRIRCIYIRHLIGRSARFGSEHIAEPPDKGSWGVSYYEEVVRGEYNALGAVVCGKCGKIAKQPGRLSSDIFRAKSEELASI